MSSYPWYVTFERDGNSAYLDVKSVSFTEPTEGYFIKIEEGEKKQYYGAFPTHNRAILSNLYEVNWYVGGADNKIEGIPNIKLDLSRADLGFPVESHLDLLYTYIYEVVADMLAMQDEIGDIWKLPDTLDCFLYAQTEVSEFIESALLQVRNKDSRNSKKAEDFDSGTELFDITMMLLRGLIALEYYTEVDFGETPEERNLRIVNVIRKRFLDYKKERMAHHPDYAHILGQLYKNELIRLPMEIGYIMDILEDINDLHWHDPALETIYQQVFLLTEFVVFHPMVQYRDYAEIASEKLTRIYNKSIAKKNAS